MKRMLVLAGVLWAAGAVAYVLPAGSILRRMVDARQEVGLSALKVEGSLSFYGAAAREAAAALGQSVDRPQWEVDGALYLRLPGRCRLEAAVLEGKPVGAVWVQGRKRVVGKEVPSLFAAVEPVCALLAMKAESVAEGRAEVEAWLRGLGVEVRSTGLARFGGEVAYVLGDMAEGKPQVWVYKESFRPARVRWSDTQGAAWDVRLLDYTSPITSDWAPRTLEVWRNGERVLRFTALQADNRVRLADSLFGA